MTKCKCAKMVQGKIIYDNKCKLFGVELEEKYEKPEDLNVLVPFVCPDCGKVEFKILSSISKK